MNVDVIFPDNRFDFAAPLMQMHRDRKRVFVDTLGWKLASACSWLEVDDFDDHRAIYLLARSAMTEWCRASSRRKRLLRCTSTNGIGAARKASRIASDVCVYAPRLTMAASADVRACCTASTSSPS